MDRGTKECVLAEYARRTYRRAPDDVVFMDAIGEVAGMWPPEAVRHELLRSGLMRPSPAGPEFRHPSFGEYYYAYGLARRADESQLREFIADHHGDRSYVQVFIFLAGLLAEEQRQAMLLDYSEQRDLYLFRRCLEARFKRTAQIQEQPPPDYARTYLGQIRESFERVVRSHFDGYRDFFEPWLSYEGDASPGYEALAIQGGLELSLPGVVYELGLVDSQQPN